jgi:adenosylhomocysteine nucleosidase
MLTIVSALPWEVERFASRLRGRHCVEIGDDAWAVRGSRGVVELRALVSGPGEANAQTAAQALEEMEPLATGVLSVGMAGGLDPALKPGALVLATRVQHRRARGGRRGPALDADRAFRGWLARALEARDVATMPVEILSRDAILRTPAEKASAFGESRAVAVQMEDYVWAEQAARLGLPFASLRAILDPAGTTIPTEILEWDAAKPAATAIARAVARRPALAVALARLARQRRAAVGALDRALEAIVAAGAPGAQNDS